MSKSFVSVEAYGIRPGRIWVRWSVHEYADLYIVYLDSATLYLLPDDARALIGKLAGEMGRQGHLPEASHALAAAIRDLAELAADLEFSPGAGDLATRAQDILGQLRHLIAASTGEVTL